MGAGAMLSSASLESMRAFVIPMLSGDPESMAPNLGWLMPTMIRGPSSRP
jgi:hypothetical protein